MENHLNLNILFHYFHNTNGGFLWSVYNDSTKATKQKTTSYCTSKKTKIKKTLLKVN